MEKGLVFDPSATARPTHKPKGNNTPDLTNNTKGRNWHIVKWQVAEDYHDELSRLVATSRRARKPPRPGARLFLLVTEMRRPSLCLSFSCGLPANFSLARCSALTLRRHSVSLQNQLQVLAQPHTRTIYDISQSRSRDRKTPRTKRGCSSWSYSYQQTTPWLPRRSDS